MQAWVIREHGGPEALRLEQRPVPEPEAEQALVRVKAVGLNHLDVWARKGVPGHHFPLPLVPGCDVVGTVESFGPLSKERRASLEAGGIREGIDVVVNPTVSCGRCEACLRGRPSTCTSFGIIGETRDGGLTEKVAVPAGNLIPLGTGLTAVEAASLPIAYVTAWSMIDGKSGLRPGDWILIQAGGSGVSVAAIQMAKLLGATVITTVGSREKAARAKALGADHVVVYTEGDWVGETRKIIKAAGKRGVEVAIDHVGAQTFGGTLRCLDWGGKLITCGATSGSAVQIDLKPVFFKSLSIIGSTMGSQADLIRVVDLTRLGKLRPVVDSTFGFNEVPRAFEKLEQRAAFGKVVVEV